MELVHARSQAPEDVNVVQGRSRVEDRSRQGSARNPGELDDAFVEADSEGLRQVLADAEDVEQLGVFELPGDEVTVRLRVRMTPGLSRGRRRIRRIRRVPHRLRLQSRSGTVDRSTSDLPLELVDPHPDAPRLRQRRGGCEGRVQRALVRSLDAHRNPLIHHLEELVHRPVGVRRVRTNESQQELACQAPPEARPGAFRGHHAVHHPETELVEERQLRRLGRSGGPLSLRRLNPLQPCQHALARHFGRVPAAEMALTLRHPPTGLVRVLDNSAHLASRIVDVRLRPMRARVIRPGVIAHRDCPVGHRVSGVLRQEVGVSAVSRCHHGLAAQDRLSHSDAESLRPVQGDVGVAAGHQLLVLQSRQVLADQADVGMRGGGDPKPVMVVGIPLVVDRLDYELHALARRERLCERLD